MTPLIVINRRLICAALVLIPLLFPTNIHSQDRCSEWDGFKRRPVPCPRSTPDPKDKGDVYIPPPPEDPRLATARQQNDLGIKAQNKGLWGTAAYHFEQALANDPNSASYRTNLSNARKQVEIEAHRRLQESLRADRKKIEDTRGKGDLKPIDSGNTFGLTPSNPGLSDLRPLDNRIERNFGKDPVWSQLNCAVDLLGRALSAAESAPGAQPSFNESRNLLNEALNALNGDREGAPCKMGGPLPRISGRAPDLSRAVTKERELLERARITVDKLEKGKLPMPEEERIAKAYAQQKEYETEKARQDAAAIEQARKTKRPQHQIVVPSPTSPPKPQAKPKSEIERLKEEAQGLISFPLNKLKPRRSATQPAVSR